MRTHVLARIARHRALCLALAATGLLAIGVVVWWTGNEPQGVAREEAPLDHADLVQMLEEMHAALER